MYLPIYLSMICALIVGSGWSLGHNLRIAASRSKRILSHRERLDGYAPMLRLLEGRDIEFLLSQPGVTERMIRRFRHSHYLIFCTYLSALREDYRQSSYELIAFLLASESDRADLSYLLIRSEFLFNVRLMNLRCRLLLYRLGMNTVNPASLIEVVAGVNGRLTALGADLKPGNA